MTFLSNVGIKAKILAAVLIMACVAVGGALYATSIMKDIRGSYDILLNHEEMGVLQTSRFTQFVSGHGYSVYRLMESKNSVTATDSDNYSSIQARAKTEYENLKIDAVEALTMAANSLPELAEDWSRKASSYQAIRKNTDRAMELVLADDITDATIVMAETDALIAALTKSSTGTVAALSDRIQKRSAALGADTQSTEYTTLAIMIGAAVMVGAAAMALAGRTITSPLGALQDAMHRLASGDLDAMVPGQGRRDEVGRMAEAVQVFKLNALRAHGLEAEATAARHAAETERARSEAARAETAQQQAEVVEGIAEGLHRLSRGDLVSRLDRAFSPEYEKLRRDFNDALTKLQQTLTIVAQNGSAIRLGTGEISNAADDLSRRTERQAASLKEAAVALDAVTTTVRRTAQNANHAKAAVLATKAGAENSGQVVRQAVQAMNDIESSSAQITQIIGVIDGIAFQTNLLALNAGVEAARAGDAGRGFAVVASEVRALAQRSAEAAKEIKGLIAAARGQVERGVDLVGRTGAALDGMVAQVGDIATEVAAIAASAQEQAAGLDQVNAAIHQMDQVTQQNAAMMEESTAASQALSAETDEFLRVIGQFQVGPSPTVGRNTRSVSGPTKQPSGQVLTFAQSRC